jgi:hypothetical protein
MQNEACDLCCPPDDGGLTTETCSSDTDTDI